MKKKPRVWAYRTVRGWDWFVTFPDGDVSSCGHWREAITSLDRWFRMKAREFRLR